MGVARKSFFVYEDQLVKVMTIGRFWGSRHSYRALSRQVDFQESRVGALDSSDRVDKLKKNLDEKY